MTTGLCLYSHVTSAACKIVACFKCSNWQVLYMLKYSVLIIALRSKRCIVLYITPFHVSTLVQIRSPKTCKGKFVKLSNICTPGSLASRTGDAILKAPLLCLLLCSEHFKQGVYDQFCQLLNTCMRAHPSYTFTCIFYVYS